MGLLYLIHPTAILLKLPWSKLFDLLAPSIAAIVGWLLTRRQGKIAKKLEEVHVLVNGNLLKALKDGDELRVKVGKLEAEVERLKSDDDGAR